MRGLSYPVAETHLRESVFQVLPQVRPPEIADWELLLDIDPFVGVFLLAFDTVGLLPPFDLVDFLAPFDIVYSFRRGCIGLLAKDVK